jgi:xanthine dehydrogenase molybdopterin-binding subunit B
MQSLNTAQGPRGDDVSQLEAAKARIAAELQLAAEKNMELEMQLSALMQGPDADKAMTAREKNHVRMQKKFESLQQRLEQVPPQRHQPLHF